MNCLSFQLKQASPCLGIGICYWRIIPLHYYQFCTRLWHWYLNLWEGWCLNDMKLIAHMRDPIADKPIAIRLMYRLFNFSVNWLAVSVLTVLSAQNDVYRNWRSLYAKANRPQCRSGNLITSIRQKRYICNHNLNLLSGILRQRQRLSQRIFM